MGFAAGKFYPSNREQLIALLNELFKGLKKEYSLKAGIVPHAGYIYSGKAMAEFWINSDRNKTYAIIGTNHTGLGSLANVSLMPIETPLGIAKIDEEAAMIFMKNGFDYDDRPFLYEHSVENQIPFLQYLHGDNFLIVPSVMFNVYRFAKEVGKQLALELPERVRLVASSDFTHYGDIYGYKPFSDGRKVKELDMKLISYILKLDSLGFYKEIVRTGATVCGWGPIVSVIEFAKERGLEPILLDYYTSGDVTGDYSLVVGYASIIFV
ncbi:NEQ347 [Nanoarchaeum equitans Kin4-M]|uniref:MEMO1 family protein NEQ347 n=1 Tax=Nanoarchaeum equitans (strain Kin4-M) TaxID=228908 RepID=Q74NK0_NANEQ|nr:NEQ347 [Nanoarchaeum equitans Kin4-M]